MSAPRRRLSLHRGGALPGAALAAVLFGASGCTSTDIFTEGRLENRCTEALPICGQRAGCVLGADQFVRGRFPGGQRVIVRTPSAMTRLVVRTLLENGTFGGTEFSARGWSTGCVDSDEAVSRDRNLLELAGDDSTLDYELDVTGRGDHLVEVFSDMSADFFLVVDREE